MITIAMGYRQLGVVFFAGSNERICLRRRTYKWFLDVNPLYACLNGGKRHVMMLVGVARTNRHDVRPRFLEHRTVITKALADLESLFGIG